MKPALELLRSEPRARLFFAAHTQSSFGTGVGYVALLLLAYERYPSPWTIAGVLLAELLPAMVLGPLAGAAADRWSRKHLLVAAEVFRAIAFAGIVLAGSLELTAGFALLAGVGNALFNPTVMAALPAMVNRERFAAATSLYSAAAELGFTAGPAVAALLLLFVDVDALLLANAVTFAISGAALCCIRLHRPCLEPVRQPRSLLRETRDGLAVVAGDLGVRVLLLSSGAVVACLGMINVGELLLAREALGTSESGFSLLVAGMGLGVAAGSLLGSSGGAVPTLKHRYLAGVAACGGALVMCGLAPSFAVALPAFFAVGVGNGVALTYECLLLQSIVSDELLGRVFGVKNALVSWAFGISFAAAGAIAALLGPRALFVVSGLGVLGAWAVASVVLRKVWTKALFQPGPGGVPGVPLGPLAPGLESAGSRAAS